MSEKLLQDYLMAQARKHGIYARKMVAVGHTGFPDIMLAFMGYVIFIELKNPNGAGRLSRKQESEIEKLLNAGVEVFLMSQREQVDDLISRIFKYEAAGCHFTVMH